MTDELETTLSTELADADSRANALLERLESEQRELDNAEPDNDNGAPGTEPQSTAVPPANTNAAPPAAPAAKPPPGKDESLDRIARLERETIQRKQEIALRERETRDRAAQIMEREAAIVAREKRFEDAGELLSYIEEKGWGDALAQHIVSMSDPDKRAEQAARKAAGKVESEVDKRLRALEGENHRLREQQVNVETERVFSSRVTEVATEAPLVARALTKRPERTIARAHAIAASFGRVTFNLDDVIIHLERELADEAAIFRDEEPQQAGSPRTNSKDEPLRTDAAAKAKTVSNRDAATRSAIVEDDGGELSLDDRIARAERRMRRSA